MPELVQEGQLTGIALRGHKEEPLAQVTKLEIGVAKFSVMQFRLNVWQACCPLKFIACKIPSDLKTLLGLIGRHKHIKLMTKLLGALTQPNYPFVVL